MLFFVGLGLEQSPTLSALEVLKDCDKIFYESYTSPAFGSDVLKTVATRSGREIERATREFIEDGRKILDLAENSKVALLSSGDPMVATTHQELRTRATKRQIKTRIIHGSSILCALPGELGLHSYSFGKSVTITRSLMQYTAYTTIYQNLLRCLHTAILLEWDEPSKFFLAPPDALKSLLEAEKDLKYGIITEDTLVLGSSEIGTGRTRIFAKRMGDALRFDFAKPPHVLVVPGRLHFTEIESLSALTGIEGDFFKDNSRGIERMAERMLSKYYEKTISALRRAKSAASEKGLAGLEPVFQNVEAYASDAQRFLNEGKEELAVLSIGYAEGLLDSLRFSSQIEFEW